MIEPRTSAAQRLLGDLLGRYGWSVTDPVSAELTNAALVAIESEAWDSGYATGRAEAATDALRARLTSTEEMLDVLDGLPAATCYRTHIERDEHLGVVGAVWKADVRRQFAAEHLLATIPNLSSESGKGETQ